MIEGRRFQNHISLYKDPKTSLQFSVYTYGLCVRIGMLNPQYNDIFKQLSRKALLLGRDVSDFPSSCEGIGTILKRMFTFEKVFVCVMREDERERP